MLLMVTSWCSHAHGGPRIVVSRPVLSKVRGHAWMMELRRHKTVLCRRRGGYGLGSIIDSSIVLLPFLARISLALYIAIWQGSLARRRLTAPSPARPYLFDELIPFAFWYTRAALTVSPSTCVRGNCNHLWHRLKR